MLQISVCQLEHGELPGLTLMVPQGREVMVSEAGVEGDDIVCRDHDHGAGQALPNPSWVVCS